MGGSYMSITLQGIDGEKLAREILLEMGVDRIFQADWLVRRDGEWCVVEVKHKAMFTPPPFYGHGLDIRQVRARQEFLKDVGIRCFFLVIDTETEKIYWQWLDVLEETDYFDTRNNVRIYNIGNFNEYQKIPQ